MVKFRKRQLVMYGMRGVFKITDVTTLVAAGISEETYRLESLYTSGNTIISPKQKAEQNGMRHISKPPELERVLKIITAEPERPRIPWTKLVEEHKGRIRSGAFLSLSEVVRDLYVPLVEKDGETVALSDQGFYEQQLFRMALRLVVEETAAINDTDLLSAAACLEAHTGKKFGFNPNTQPVNVFHLQQRGPRKNAALAV